MFVYLDNSATTRPRPEVVEAMNEALTSGFGNPSSMYRLGLSAEKAVREARIAVARSIGASEKEIFFTSGGTESDNTALKSVWESRRKQGRHIITSSVEHPAILECCRWLERQGAEVTYLPVSPDGKVSPEALRAALRDDTVLVSIMHVNNESGAVMPVEAFREVLRETGSGALLHCDAVQSWGKLPIDVRKLGADMLSLSAHKVHGPKGVGVLYVREGLHIPVFMHGGGQESGFRSGTENTAGIAGMGKAAELLTAELPERTARMAALRARLLSGIRERISDIKVNGPDDAVCSVLNVSFLGCRGEVLLHTLDESGVCVSTGSACSSHSKGSHVLSAMGLSPEEIQGAVRFSLSEENTEEEIGYALEKLEAAVMMQRRLAGFRKGRR
jgi:cysteine desulfurase